jgi:hypothetical protein
MAITHRTTLHWSGSGAGSLNLSGAVTETANAEQNRVLAIAAATPDQEFDLDFPFAALKSFFAISTQDVTIETNDGSAPDDTITLKAGVPVWWAASSSLASPFTADVDSIFVTNAGDKAATVNIRVLYDATL